MTKHETQSRSLAERVRQDIDQQRRIISHAAELRAKTEDAIRMSRQNVFQAQQILDGHAAPASSEEKDES